MSFCNDGVTEVVSERSKLTIKWSPCPCTCLACFKAANANFLDQDILSQMPPKKL